MNKYDDNQIVAINEYIDKNVLVSAAAGSGKTTVLTDRIVRIITDESLDCSFKDMAIMTFTNKATEEMKTRIKEKLEKKLSENKKDKRLIREIALIPNAEISTINSFCKRILDENYSELIDFDPSYRIASENELSILCDDVLDDLLDNKYMDDYYKSLFDAYFKKNDDRLKDVILKGYKFLQSLAFPIDFIDNNVDGYIDNVKSIFEIYKGKVKNRVKDILKCLEHLDKAIDLIDDIVESLKTKKSSQTLGKLANLSDYLKTNIQSKIDYKILLETLDDDIFNLIYERFDKKNMPDISRLSIPDDFKEEYQKIVLPILSLSDDNDRETLTNYANLLVCDENYIININEKKILELLRLFYINVENEKKRKNIISISDTEKLALNILYEKIDGEYVITKKAQEISKRYKYLFIDEYQDTSYIEEAVISAITNKFQNENTFIVGDIKQSIYGFRNAEPSIFAEKFANYSNDIGGHSIILDKNHRSTKEIIMFINSLFCKLMYDEYGKVNYIKDGMLGIPDDMDDSNEKVEVINLYSDDKTDDRSKDEKEASYVANKIKELVDSKKYKYSDIVILLRNVKNKAEIYNKALLDRSIPSYADLNRGFYGRFEIKLMIDILNVIDNPLQDIPLASVLVSSIYNVSDNELAFIKLAYDKYVDVSKKEKFLLYDAVSYIVSSNNIEDIAKNNGIDYNILKQKLSKFIDDFNTLSFKARYFSISEIIAYIYDKLNVKNIIASMPGGNIRTANLDILYKNAKAYESSSYVGLFNFLRFIEKVIDRQDDEGIAKIFDENDNIVRIMSIHGSKGLGFKVVFLCGVAKKFNFKDLQNDCIYSIDYGVGLDYIDADNNYSITGVRKNLIIENMRDRIVQEEIRMLYVAMTRAIGKLFIIGFSFNNLKKEIDDNISIEKTFDIQNTFLVTETQKKENIDFISTVNSYMELIVRYSPYGASFCKIENVCVDVDTEENQDIYECDLLNAKLDIDKSDIESLPNIDFDDTMLIDYKYKYLNSLKPKYSVTAIKELSNHDKINMYDNKESYSNSIYDNEDLYEEINDNIKRLDGTDIGNAYHRYMQFYDYEKNIYNCEHEKTAGISIDDIVDKNKIDKFLNTELGKRIRKASQMHMLYREHKFMKLVSQNEINLYAKIAVDNDSNFDEKNVILQGIIDAFFIEKDVDGNEYIILLDYKTDSISKTSIEKETFRKELIDRYAVQLNMYEKVLTELTALPVKEKYIYSFAIDEQIKI